MNEMIKLFGEFIEQRTIYAKLVKDGKRAFQLAFALALFTETQKCRMSEDERNLCANAAKALVHEYCNDFESYLQNLGIRIHWCGNDWQNFATAIAGHMKGDFYLKLAVKSLLRSFRKELFEEVTFRQYVNEYIVEEHPMKTFVYWLDFIEGLNGTVEYKSLYQLKRNLVNMTRVGNAIFDRCEWCSSVETSSVETSSGVLLQ